MQILIRNGQVVDPAAGTVQKADVLVEDGKIEKIAPETVSYTHLTLPTNSLV